MHDIRHDPVHDEIIVPNQFAQAILTFAGGASGEQPPLRVIQGSRTQLIRAERLDIDTVNNEIVVPNGNSILVFRRDATGNVAPIRTISGATSPLAVRSKIASALAVGV